MEFYIQNTTSISPQQTFEADGFLSQPTIGYEGTDYLSAIEPNYKECIADAGLRRRMSRIIKMGVASALRCVSEASVENPDAIITATGLGCLTDTEKFLNSIVANNEQLLNPTSFIQSTFNTIGAQIALILKNHGYNFTYVHRGFSFESALLDAMLQLEDNDAQNVLVGAIDEITPISYRIMQRMGLWSHGAKMGEGAQFFMLSSRPSNKDYARLKSVSIFLSSEDKVVEKEIGLFLQKNGVSLQDIDLVLLGNNGDLKNDLPFFDLQQKYLNDISVATFKHLCGEYPTASSFGVWCASNVLKNQELPLALNPSKKLEKIEKVLIYNKYGNTNNSLFLLEKV